MVKFNERSDRLDGIIRCGIEKRENKRAMRIEYDTLLAMCI